MKSPKVIVFCIVWTVIVAVTILGIRFAADPQRQIDQHITAMRSLHEQLNSDSDPEAMQSIWDDWYRRSSELIQLSYLEKKVYHVPMRGDQDVQETVFAALDNRRAENWLSVYSYRPGPADTIEIDVIDEPSRIPGWTQVINENLVPEE